MLTHDSLLIHLREQENFSMWSDNEFLKMIFTNYKPSSKKGWRLSLFGLNTLSKHIQPYRHIDTYSVTTKDLITLSKIMNSPYFIDQKKKSIIVFDPIIYTLLVCGGIETLLVQV